MLKSISFINRLEEDLRENSIQKNISDFYIELRVNQNIDVYIVSNEIQEPHQIFLKAVSFKELENQNVQLTFLTEKKSQEDEYAHLFSGEKVSYGLRRSLSALLDMKDRNIKAKNVVTFFSYKGGVGRTTSLALTAIYLARKGKNVFVMDCDFEAPGLVNFFNSAQTDNKRNGLIEYLNDQMFTEDCNIEDYVYKIEKSYSGDGSINMLAAGNITSGEVNLVNYLEGLAKVDLQGERLVGILTTLIEKIDSTYSPDIILIDSRTGFNNTFGALAQLSKHVVVLAGDDAQNLPGIEYITRTLNEMNISACFVLSILSSNFSRRYNNFTNQIHGLSSFEAETFYFDRQNTLEYVGTSLEDKYDLDDFIDGENGSTQYHKFFNYIYQLTIKPETQDNQTAIGDTSDSGIETFIYETNAIENEEDDENNKWPTEIQNSIYSSSGANISVQDEVLNSVKWHLPNLYAENIHYSDEYIKQYFYFRPCMEDLFIPEKNILLGDKGTGKTAFYKALQIDTFFQMLTSKAQKTHIKYQVFNITNFEQDNFEFLGFDEHIKEELFIKKFWIFYIWNAICSRSGYKGNNNDLLVELNKLDAGKRIISIINNTDAYERIELELEEINKKLKSEDRRLIAIFDQLDNIVKPFLWNDVVSPLVKIVMRFPYDYIQPKLFLRRDLYERLGNLTNKSSFSARTIDLEWSQNEIFSYFLKIVFSYSKDSFFTFLDHALPNKALIAQIRKKLKTKSIEHNQLPLDKFLIQPVINVFFGHPRARKNRRPSTAYEDLYRNIQSADKTVNLRPFIDLITNAIHEQEERDDQKKLRKGSILGLAYCTTHQVRKSAVVNYLKDLWNEKGNEFVKCFCTDLENNKVSGIYKKNVLNEDTFDKLLEEVKSNHSDIEAIKNGTLSEFKQILIATKIITPYMVGSKTRYGFAYLYTNYLGI